MASERFYKNVSGVNATLGRRGAEISNLRDESVA
jgi:hypothetical protein